jgi:uncharacterized protein with LGFP repeats
VIAENETAPARWMIDRSVEKWTALGGADGDLGLPLTDADFVDGLPRQEFERGGSAFSRRARRSKPRC